MPVPQGGQQGAGGKRDGRADTCSPQKISVVSLPFGMAFGKREAGHDLHMHSIPNCLWDVRRNAEGLTGQHQVPLLRTS